MGGEVFKEGAKTKILEPGAGQGRDTSFFAKNGFEVYSLDYSKNGIQVIEQKDRENGLSEHVTTSQLKGDLFQKCSLGPLLEKVKN